MRSWSRDGRIIAGMLLLLPLVDLSLRLGGLKRTQRLLGLHQPLPLQHNTPGTYAYAARVAHLAAGVGRRSPWKATCLRQALAVQWWLQRGGIPTELHIGARPEDGKLVAHAWTTYRGRPLGQAGELPPEIDLRPVNDQANHPPAR